ncbi:retrovirus-related pol polyprotein from transposon TNT 1-94 [Tanacetum coccineum]
MLALLVLQGLRESRKLKHGALSLYVGNGMRAAVEAIRSFDLVLPSGLIIVLDNCHYAPTITRGVVSIPCLVNNGYIHTFTNYGISVLKDNVFYFNAIPCDGIYEIDMHNLYPNVSSMFNVSNKKAKHMLDSSYLWHCLLGHINKKRIDKLHRDGILQLTHDESLEKCKSCIFGNIARKPFPHQVEKAKDLLGLIHTYRNGKLLDMVRSMMNLTTLPKSFWGYALESAVRILNMVLTKKVERTPYEIWHGKAPKLSYLRVWGCEVLVKRDTPGKHDPRSIKCIFVGYPKETIGTDKTNITRKPSKMGKHGYENRRGDLDNSRDFQQEDMVKNVTSRHPIGQEKQGMTRG